MLVLGGDFNALREVRETGVVVMMPLAVLTVECDSTADPSSTDYDKILTVPPIALITMLLYTNRSSSLATLLRSSTTPGWQLSVRA